MRSILFAVVLFVSTTALISCTRSNEVERIALFESFLSTVRDRNYSEMSLYVAENRDFFRENKLRVEIREFVYGKDDGDYLRNSFRPIVFFLNAGTYSIEFVEQSNGNLLYLLVPDIYASDASNVEFYEEQWMLKYFACEFSNINGRWKMTTNFCFAETGGPYHRPYG